MQQCIAELCLLNILLSIVMMCSGEKLVLKPVFADWAGWYKTSLSHRASLHLLNTPLHTVYSPSSRLWEPTACCLTEVSIFISQTGTFKEAVVCYLWLSQESQLSHCLPKCNFLFVRLFLEYVKKTTSWTDFLENAILLFHSRLSFFQLSWNLTMHTSTRINHRHSRGFSIL